MEISEFQALLEVTGWEDYAHLQMVEPPNPFAFQDVLIDKTEAALKQFRRTILQCPTGSGKTVMGVKFAKQWPNRVLVLSHRQELVEQWQNQAKGWGATRLYARTIQQHLHPKFIEIYNWSSRDLLIVDECHHYVDNRWEEAVENWPGRILGLTATPARSNPYKGFDHFWNHLIVGPSKKELIRKRAMVPARVINPKFGYIEGRGESEDGDFSMTATMALFASNVLQKAAMVEKGVNWLQDEVGDEPALIFTCTIKHAGLVQEYCDSAGIKARTVTSLTPKGERKRIYEDFAFGRIQRLITVVVLTEGMDLPMCSAALILRPTRSIVLYLQMVGRTLRKYPGKKYGVILDAAGNHTRLGHPDDDHYWTLAPRQWDPRPSRICEFCDTVNSADNQVCESCGMPLPIASRAGAKLITCSRCGRRYGALKQVCPYCSMNVDQDADPSDHPDTFGHRNFKWFKERALDTLIRYESELPAFNAVAWIEQKSSDSDWTGGIKVMEDEDSDLPAVVDVVQNQVVFRKVANKQPYKVVDTVINKIKQIDRLLY